MARFVDLPPLHVVKQSFDTTRERDLDAAVARELGKLNLKSTIQPGETVALTAGSRGISRIDQVLRAAVASLRGLGAEPFIVPAMGSHGGGSAEGQTKVLAGYGITEESVGAPIRASMEVIEIGRHPEGGPVYLDRIASTANHIGVVGRIKPHTGFTGSIESGLVKMMMIGLGKHEGAKEYHRVLVRSPWEPFARSVAPVVLANAPIRFGLAIIENALDETAHIEAVEARRFLEREPALLELARRHLPRIPLAEVDVLIIDEIGKDISGSGADTNVIGRKPAADWNERDLRRPDPLVHRIVVRGLSAGSHGNAAGIGLADFTTDRLIEQMDYRSTVINCLTANHPLAAAIPIHFPADADCIERAADSVGRPNRTEVKIAWIENTLKLETIGLTCVRDLQGERATPIRKVAWPFDREGNLPLLREVIAAAEGA